MGSAKITQHRRRICRLGAVLPVVLATVLALTTGALSRSPAPSIAPAAAVAGTPIGALGSMFTQPGGVRAKGWAIDPDDKRAAVRINARVDGQLVAGQNANLPRPDVASVHPIAGPNHGFSFDVPVPEGEHKVCVRALNIGDGALLLLRCAIRTFDYGPAGAFDKLRTPPGHLVVGGWAVDQDAPTTPVKVNVLIDGAATQITADRFRKDVGAAHPIAGGDHGFAATLPLKQGTHRICVTAVDIGYGRNNSFGCKSVTLNDNPKGAFESAGQSNGALQITGWAFDNDKPTAALALTVRIDGLPHLVTANRPRPDIGTKHPVAGPYHGFVARYKLAEGAHKVCVTAHNIGYGANTAFPCVTRTLNFTPTAVLASLTATSTGLHVHGWAADPDTTKPISVAMRIDGRLVRTQVARGNGLGHNGHVFTATLRARSGTRRVCVTGLNTLYGTHNSQPSCQSITFAFKPLGAFERVSRVYGSSDLRVKGWALDPDTLRPITARVRVDGVAAGTVTADATRTDIGDTYPPWGDNHGLWARVTADDGEHTVCVTAVNVGGGADVNLGCKLIIAVHPIAPSAPRNVQAVAGYGGADVTWAKPRSDGGAPWTKYIVTSNPGAVTVTVGPGESSATLLGLKPNTSYTFTVQAVNVAGRSAGGTSTVVQTQASPPPQTTPAPVSTSRYIRNIRASSPTERAMMRSEGARDAYYNPSGHGYVVLLDIGGQDQYDGGVVLSAGVRFVTYDDLVADLKAYVSGYDSKQKPGAPVTIAIGTNNDMDVSRSSGRTWARRVVQPVVDFARRYPGITIAGANDIEPGFRASYSQTKEWLDGYLASTNAPFVFNGSADGCSWTSINSSCYNGWRMSGLYRLAAGTAPVRMLNLPQVYNTTMAAQWKYISLTGIAAGRPRIRFGGPLTEWTACSQARTCGSLTGHTAWQTMWDNLQSDNRLKVASLPYSTDLRIDS